MSNSSSLHKLERDGYDSAQEITLARFTGNAIPDQAWSDGVAINPINTATLFTPINAGESWMYAIEGATGTISMDVAGQIAGAPSGTGTLRLRVGFRYTEGGPVCFSNYFTAVVS